MSLEIKKLHITVDTKPIVNGIDLILRPGEVHVIMGQNGSGKSTLANTLMGHPKYKVAAGKIILNKKDITELSPDKRARLGLFLSLQHPPEIPGVTVANFLRTTTQTLTGKNVNPLTFHQTMLEYFKKLDISPEFAKRYVHKGFSGGEKKRLEILQLLMFGPTYAVLDETDSGLDVDALKIVAEGINKFITPKHGVLLITHYNRILKYVIPDFVHIMHQGKIIKSGTKKLAEEVEKNGYASFI